MPEFEEYPSLPNLSKKTISSQDPSDFEIVNDSDESSTELERKESEHDEYANTWHSSSPED